MIAYLDSSVLARVYLADEDGHDRATELLADPQIVTATGTWTRIEVSGALMGAARSGRVDVDGLLAALDADLSPHGPVVVLGAAQDQVEQAALALVREHAIRAMDAWHLAVASLTLPSLTEPGEEIAFVSRDQAQSAVARRLGFAQI